MDGSHIETLNYVEMDDVPHVEKMLTKLDAYASSDGKAVHSLGNFLMALVIGDLFRAVCHADTINLKYLDLFVKYVYNDLPGTHVHLAGEPLRAIRKVMWKHVVLTRAMVDDATRAFDQRLQELTAN